MASASVPHRYESGIYQIRNTVNAKRYIGSACSIGQRWNEHRSALERGKHVNRHLQFAWIRHGRSSFAFEVMLVCRADELIRQEQSAFDRFKPEYNVARFAGSTLGRKHSAETKAKIAAKAIGRKWTDESKAKVSNTMTGRKMGDAFSEKLRGNKHAVGLKHTDEWKAANSLRNTGKKRPKDAAYREKIAATLRGRKATPEARANQSAAQLGTKRGPYKKRPKYPAAQAA